MSYRYRPSEYESDFNPRSRDVNYEINNKKAGNCKKWLAEVDRECGVPFTGSPNRRYCNEHSDRIKLTGLGK